MSIDRPADPMADQAPADPFADLKRQALEDFRTWLDALGEADLEDLGCQAASAPASPPGMQTLLGELVALRQDVRLQARSSQTAGQRLEDLGQKLESGLNQAASQLGQAATAAKTLVPEARREAQRAVALELVAIVEGLARCQASIQELALPRIPWGKRRAAFRQQLVQPLDLLLTKGLDSLHRLRLAAIASVGSPFDPACMRAVGTSKGGSVPPGHVANVVRQGYRLGEELLQTADVNVESP